MNKGNGKLAVKRTATGLGLFALKPMPAGKKIIEYTGSIITLEEANKSRSKYLFELDDKRAIDGSVRSNTARYINHSCEPNAIAVTTGRRVWVSSLRDVEAGEEITLDYGEQYMDTHIKRCKCESCAPRKIKRSQPPMTSS
ncbi:MAG: SET domain-containing protein [Pyrinomonadaceae bacterium]|nr:SET domain-containing protein [Pyrinomonadaceae bacterium]